MLALILAVTLSLLFPGTPTTLPAPMPVQTISAPVTYTFPETDGAGYFYCGAPGWELWTADGSDSIASLYCQEGAR